jgi:hypothetical protein
MVCLYRDRGFRHQELAHFARRAHRQFGRGFVLFDDAEARPVYITWLAGAPQGLIEVVLGYDPTREAVIVTEDDNGADAITIDRVSIQSVH